MALPITIPNTFANANAAIPLSQLDNNFSTVVVAINGIGNGAEALSNVNITGGAIANVTLSSANANITGGNVSNVILSSSNVNITGGSITNTNVSTANANITGGTANLSFVSLANGNASAPSVRFTDDSDTGFFLSGANAVSFTEGGTAGRIGYRNIPDGGPKNTAYTLATSDVGKYVQITSGGSINIPDATFTNGDVVSLFNNTNAAVNVTCSITTAYIAGTDTDKASVSLATRGVASILFISNTVCVITGNVS